MDSANRQRSDIRLSDLQDIRNMQDESPIVGRLQSMLCKSSVVEGKALQRLRRNRGRQLTDKGSSRTFQNPHD